MRTTVFRASWSSRALVVTAAVLAGLAETIREGAAAQAWRRSLTLAFLPTRERK